MEKIRRSIRLFFAQYGKLLFYIITIIVMIIISIQELNKLAIEKNNEKEVKIEEQNQINQKKEENEKIIIEFIENCNKGKIEQAYNMLSKQCKQEKYSTLEIFKNEYINKVFNISIYEYQVKENDGIYTVILKEDMLITGKVNSIKEQKISITEEIIEKKIYIN